MALNKPVRRIAIVGTGVIGASWAAEFLCARPRCGRDGPEHRMPNRICGSTSTQAWPALTEGTGEECVERKTDIFSDLKETVSRADLVQENGPERPDFKIKLFAEIDAATPTDSIIASSSSGITMSVTQSACAHPERCVIGHPFNPPHMVPLVEVVGGAKTSPETVRARDRVLRIHWQKADPPSQRSRRACCQSASGRRLSRGGEPDPPRRSRCCRRRYGSLLGTRVALGRHGAPYLFHLAGGEGGIQHFMDHLSGPVASWWKDLAGFTDWPEGSKKTIVEGIKKAADGRSIDELDQLRDEVLLELVQDSDEAGRLSRSSRALDRRRGNCELQRKAILEKT